MPSPPHRTRRRSWRYGSGPSGVATLMLSLAVNACTGEIGGLGSSPLHETDPPGGAGGSSAVTTGAGGSGGAGTGTGIVTGAGGAAAVGAGGAGSGGAAQSGAGGASTFPMPGATGGAAGTTGTGGAGATGTGGAGAAGGAAGSGGAGGTQVVVPVPPTQPTAPPELPPGTRFDAAAGKIVPLDAAAAGPRPLARLSRREYNNSVRDLLGDTTRPADKFVDDKSEDFLFRRAEPIAPHDADLLQSTAQALATNAIKNIAALTGCTTTDEACARTFVQTFGLKAYRRPLTTAETTRYLALYNTARTTLALPFPEAIGLLLQAMLQSPPFLYHWERGPEERLIIEGKVARLGAYEIASRLSYFIWGSMPDDALFKAATANALATPAQLEAQASRMLADAKARDTVADFFAQLLEVATLPDRPKNPTLYPTYTPSLAVDMALETSAFVKSVMFDGDGKLETVLGANFTFVNAPLSNIYGAPVQGTTMQKFMINPAERRGILTQTAFLAANASSDGSHPPRRGKAVYEKLLCGELPPPPMGVPPVAPASTGGTTRQRYAVHDELACARGCHSIMDPLGFAFEHYDAIGQYRTMDNGGKVDASTVVHLDHVDVPVANAVELAAALSKSQTVRDCVATQWLRYALGRHVIDADGAAILQARAGFAVNDYRLQDLMKAISGARSFQYRTPSAGEPTL